MRGRVLRSVGWIMASQGSTQVLAFITSVAIARLMSPRDVGLATEASVFATLALVISDFGIGAVIIQRPQLTEADTNTAFWTSIGFGAALTAIGIGLSWPIAALYGHPEIQPLFAVLSFVFVLTAPSIVQGTLLMRQLDFRSLEVRTIIATSASAATAITLAALGFGPWAIIIQSLVISGVSSALLWRACAFRPRWIFSMASLRGMTTFAGHTFGANAVSWAQLNCDNLLVGRFLGPSSLGAYSIASSASLTPLNRIAAPITTVFFPAFSRMEDPERIGAVWLRALRMIALVVVPITLGLVVVGQEFVVALFGARWHRAVTPLEVMVPIGLMQALNALSNGILSSIGRTRLLWRASATIAAVSVASFAAGLHWGIDGVAVAYLAANVVTQPVLLHLTARSVGLTLRDALLSVSGVLQAGIGMLIVVGITRRLLVDAGLPVGARLAVLVVVGTIVYLPLIAWRAPGVRVEISDVIHRRESAEPEPEPAVGVIAPLELTSTVESAAPAAAVTPAPRTEK